MPRRLKIPALKLHAASGQARVRLAGKRIYLGPFGSVESYGNGMQAQKVDIVSGNSNPGKSRRDPHCAPNLRQHVESRQSPPRLFSDASSAVLIVFSVLVLLIGGLFWLIKPKTDPRFVGKWDWSGTTQGEPTESIALQHMALLAF